jgi:hypothetical protein
MQRLELHPRVLGQRVELQLSDRADPIWWEWEGPEGWVLPRPANADWAAVAGLVVAQRCGGAMHVAGAVDRRLLENLERYSQVWAQWLPDYFFPVEITADKETTSTGSNDRRYAFAHSGGVDASFCLMRHARGLAGQENRRPAWAVTINGYDRPAADGPGCADFRAAAGAIAAAAGVPHLFVSTSATDMGIDASMQHQIGVAATLHQLNRLCSNGVVAADYTYAEEFDVHPHGSNCCTNPLLASGDFELLTSGGAFTRADKVAWLMSEPAVVPQLRVCRRAAVTGKNCGRCEKCVRTAIMALAASGNKRLPMFDRPLTATRILLTKVRSESSLPFWKQARSRLEAKHWSEKLAITVAILLGQIRSSSLMRSLKAADRRFFSPLGRRIGAVFGYSRTRQSAKNLSHRR